jgi:quercetin dioxygenase-like cupin family protein
MPSLSAVEGPVRARESIREIEEQGEAMEIARAQEAGFVKGDDARFSGEVWLRATLSSQDKTNLGVVHFAPGARTRWHRHPGGQFLYGVSGRGRVRTRGEAGLVLEPGDVIHVGADEWHFHGGTPTTPLVHVAVNGGGDPEWAEPVTDEQFDEGF